MEINFRVKSLHERRHPVWKLCRKKRKNGKDN